ncbi:hypothetical protein [Microseira wollei]|uniref:hypothetical protein n=1 Tax=Microseira wollei TaxID=467598 RepID=UPI001CFEA573|nr:hypothetical protein [Microseira wollei]
MPCICGVVSRIGRGTARLTLFASQYIFDAVPVQQLMGAICLPSALAGASPPHTNPVSGNCDRERAKILP